MVYKPGLYVQSKVDVHNGVCMIVHKGDIVQIDGIEGQRLIVKDLIGARVLIDPASVTVLRDQDNIGHQIQQIRLKRSAAEMGRLGGSATSKAKRAASAANGRKGGRPRKVTPSV